MTTARALDILVRAAKTFLQAFIAVLIASSAGPLDIDTVEAAATAGLAALLSFINNLLTTAEEHAAWSALRREEGVRAWKDQVR